MSEDSFDRESKAPSATVREAIARERNLLRRASTQGEHFWVSTYPFFESTILLTRGSAESEGDVWADISLFDCDGAPINTVQVGFGARALGVVELDPMLVGCKLESGLKYAHAQVTPQIESISAMCRLTTQDHAAMFGPSFSVYPFLPGFFPISFDETQGNYLAVINYGDEEASVRCRLFFGSRTPEVTIAVPGRGARFIGIEGEFPECFDRSKERTGQAYVRLTTKSDSGLGVQLLTRSEGARDTSLFSTVA